MKYFLAICAFVAVCNGVFAQDIAQTSPKEPSETKNVFELAAPIDVLEANRYQDGGTIAIFLKDKNGKTFWFLLSTNWTYKTPEPPRYIDVGVQFPSEGGIRLPLGGNEEKALLLLLEDWYTRHNPSKPVDLLSGDRISHYIDEVIEVLKSR